MSARDIENRIYVSNYLFLTDIDFNKKNPADIQKLAPGAPYYFSFIFRKMGMDDAAVITLSAGWKRGPRNWRMLCGEELITRLLELKRFGEAEIIAAEFVEKFSACNSINKIKKAHLESLYRQEKDKKLLLQIEEYFGDLSNTGKEHFDPELLLFRGVALHRLGQGSWREVMTDLFLRFNSSLLHTRIYKYLEYNGLPESLSEIERKLFSAKSHLTLDRKDKAIPLMEAVLEAWGPSLPEESSIIKEYGFACRSQGDFTRGARFLTSLAAGMKGKNHLTSLEMAGRLNKKRQYHKIARGQLMEVYKQSNDPLQKDRVLWFYLDSIKETLAGKLLDEIILYAGRWNDPEYFADLLDWEITYLVSTRYWKGLWSLYVQLKDILPPETKPRLHYILSRLFITGRLQITAGSGASSWKELLGPPGRDNRALYYNFMLSHFYGSTPGALVRLKGQNREKYLIMGDKEINVLISGFFNYGLTSEGLSILNDNLEDLGKETALAAAESLLLRGRHYDLIIFMGRINYTGNYILERRELEYYFPALYKTEITRLANEEGFLPVQYYALIRTESAFKTEVTSTAGAVGLSQLMPETAMEIGRQLGMDNPDISDPGINLKIGARYFGKLVKLLGNLPDAYMAYNAGLTRVRRWQKKFNDLPPDLFIEAIPFTETRSYVRKVLVAAIMYNALYYGIDFKKTIKTFYP